MRKVARLTEFRDTVLALATDNTVWMLSLTPQQGAAWFPLPPLPQDKLEEEVCEPRTE